MTAAVSLMRPGLGSVLPAPTVPQLSTVEQDLVTGLAQKLALQTPDMLTRWAYYDGLQRFTNLGISIPPQLEGVRTVVDWPRVCCDPLVERVQLDGVRLPDATEVDDDLAAHFEANDFAAELPLAVLDMLVTGRGYLIVGSPDRSGDSPLLTVESPLNLAMTWNPRTRSAKAAYQAYELDNVFYAVLYLPDQTISMSRDRSAGKWTVNDRDRHNFGEVPVVRLANRARTSDREGASEITAAVMNTTDSACRSLLGMEIAREVYSIPRLAILGASESDFVNAAGERKSAIDMAMTRIVALERDEEGELPQITQLTAFDPSVFTKIIDEHAQLMASYTGFPPDYFGQHTNNPASADSIRVAMNRSDRRGDQLCRAAAAPVRKAAQLVWRFANDGRELPVRYKQLTADWVDTSTPTPAATTDAVTKQVFAGVVPATSDVTLARLGYSRLDRKRLEQDRNVAPAAQLESELTAPVANRQTRAGNALANVLEQAADNAGGTESPTGQAGR